MFSAFFFLFLCQQNLDATRPAEAIDMLRRANEIAANHERTASSARQQQVFAQRFNKLVDAVKEFEDEYSQNQGHVWPARKAAKLERAMKELSSSLSAKN